MAKIRTIEKAFQDIKKADPGTCITRNFIRQLVINGNIPSKKSGGRYYFDLDDLLNYLKGNW